MTQTISFIPAIFITLNIMLGSGLFLNTVPLAQLAGYWGFLAYGVIGILMLPLVFGISRLIGLYPHGGFYAYGANEIHPLVGFASAWIYFIGKLASATLMIHTASLLMQAMLPCARSVPVLAFDILLILFFCALNTGNMQLGSIIQYVFFAAKLIPVLCMILMFLAWFFQGHTMPIAGSILNLPATLPLVLYATVGFEAACSLSSKIKNAHLYGPRVILYAYAGIVLLNSIYQFSAYSLLGSALGSMQNFVEVFRHLASFFGPQLAVYMQYIFYITIVTSVLGAAYGILYSNIWNLYIIAQHNHTWGRSMLLRLNMHNIPMVCVFIEGLICIFYVLISQGAQLPLQQISALAIVLTYSMSAYALLSAVYRGTLRCSYFMPICSLINCGMLGIVCVKYLLRGGSSTLAGFFVLFAVGLYMACDKRQQGLRV